MRLELGESEAAVEVWYLVPGIHRFDFLSSSMSSQPDLSSSVCGRGRGVLSDWDSEKLSDASWVIVILLSFDVSDVHTRLKARYHLLS